MPYPLSPLPADLAAPEELLQVLLDISHTGIMLLRPLYAEGDAATITDFAWAYLNPTAQQLTGLPPQPTGTLLDLFPAARHSGIFDFYCAAFLSGQSERRWQPYTPAKATTGFHVAARRQGGVLAVDFTGTTAWPRPVVEAALREAETDREHLQEQQLLLEQILGKLPAALAITHGPEHRFTYFNEQYATLSQGRAQLGSTVAELFPEAVAQGYLTTLDEAYATGQPHSGVEVPLVLIHPATGQPTQLYLDNHYRPLFTEQGEPQGMLAFMVDTTDKVLARRAAEASAQQLRLVTDALPALVACVDRNYRYQFANEAYQRWFGEDVGDLVGKYIPEVVGEQAFAAGLPYMERALAGERLSFDVRLPYRPDLVRYVHADYIPHIQHGEVIGFYALISDTTDQVQARDHLQELNEEMAAINEELQASNEELQHTNLRLTRTNQDLDSFVYTASHDLKAPIANLEGLLVALREELPPEALTTPGVADVLGFMAGATTRFRQTLSHLTSIAKLQQAHAEPAQAIDLRTLIQGIRLDLSPLIGASKATLTLDLDDCPTMQFAPQHLRSILYNLLSNAIKYQAPGRPPQVHLSATHTTHHVVLAVHDNGLGLTPDQQGKLFGLFRRLHDHVEGSGVGLYMVKKLVENAGGTIRVASQAGLGSIFTVLLPLRPVAAS